MSEAQLAWPASHNPRLSGPSGVRQRQPNRGHGQGQRKRGHRDEWLTVDQVCAELNIGRRTLERWRTLGIAPRATGARAALS